MAFVGSTKESFGIMGLRLRLIRLGTEMCQQPGSWHDNSVADYTKIICLGQQLGNLSVAYLISPRVERLVRNRDVSAAWVLA